MKILVRNTPEGLKPEYNSDYEERKKLKMGKQYWADISVARNPKNHKRFFAMINVAWHNLNDQDRAKFPNKRAFRYDLIIKAGYYQLIHRTDSQVIVKPESISFDSMDEAEFQEVFSDVIDVIFEHYVDVDKENFLNAMLDFM